LFVGISVRSDCPVVPDCRFLVPRYFSAFALSVMLLMLLIGSGVQKLIGGNIHKHAHTYTRTAT
jgi:hypothetical protein